MSEVRDTLPAERPGVTGWRWEPNVLHTSDWWLDCQPRSSISPSRTMLLAFAEPGQKQASDVTRAYAACSSWGVHGLGTMATRLPDDLRTHALRMIELSLIGVRPGTFRRMPGDYVAPESTSLSVLAPGYVGLPATVPMRELLRWTGGSADTLAWLLGASRRSVYNWLKGRPVRGEFALRTRRLRDVLASLGEEWHPEALVRWLREGSPARAELAREEHWAQLEEEVRSALAPLRPDPEAEQWASSPSPPEALSSAIVTAALQEFNSSPPMPARARGEWRPRELTGATPQPDEG